MSKTEYFWSILPALPLCFALGCGGDVAPGVADGPDEEPPAMSAEEEATEAEAARNAAGQ
ncbi:MAG: hypothetical protein KDA81_19730 [Planctomycetaceae bacterium]|nr:hypothetical protein [Planctomycetaceae bacterium]